MLVSKTVQSDPRSDVVSELREFIRQNSVLREGPYKLASGGISDTFFDMKQTLLHPRGLDMVGDLVLEEVLKYDDVRAVGGLVVGACPIADAVALKSLDGPSPISAFYVRKEAKSTGTQSRIEGPAVPGASVVVLDDVTTKGGSVLQAVKAVREEWGCQVRRVVTVVDRQTGARDLLSEHGLELTPLFLMSEFSD